VRRSKELPFGGEQVDTSGLVKRIGDLLYRLAHGDTPVGWDASAIPLWREVYSDLSRDRAGLVGSVTSRAEAQVLRTALIYTLLDGENNIAEPHLQAALELWRYCEQSVTIIFGTSTGDPLADEIHRMLKASPDGLTKEPTFTTYLVGIAAKMRSGGRWGFCLVLVLLGRKVERLVDGLKSDGFR